MAKTYEIARDQWEKYFEGLSKKELKHPVHIEVESKDIGDEEMTRQLPLLGVSLELKGSERGAVDILVGRQGERGALDHRIEHVRRVEVMEDDNGDPKCLDLEDEDNGKTLIYFD